jgi:hypothetical protein
MRSFPALLLVLLGPLAGLTRAEVQIERTFLPFDVAPSSFAIGLPGGINFCYDPVRAGVCYAWTGGFLDLKAVRPGVSGKFLSPAGLLGPVVYRETGATPLRRGDPAHVPVCEFKGYVLRDNAVEFRYTLDGVLVHEDIRASATGGLVRRFRIEGASDAKWWYAVDGEPASALTRTNDGQFVLEVKFGGPKP